MSTLKIIQICIISIDSNTYLYYFINAERQYKNVLHKEDYYENSYKIYLHGELIRYRKLE